MRILPSGVSLSLARTLNNFILSLWGQVLPVPRKGHSSLMYHSISESDDIFAVDSLSLARQLDKLIGQGIKFSQFGAVGCEKSFFVSVTFDDGYLDNLTVAAPILLKRKIPFTVFVISDFVKNGQPGYLTPAALKELSSLPGVQIGSHSKSHIDLTKLTAQQLRSELEDSKSYLQEITGQPIATMSFPFGLYNDEVVKAALAAGYKKMGTSDYFRNQEDGDLCSRICIMAGETDASVYGKIKGSWDYYKKIRRLIR